MAIGYKSSESKHYSQESTLEQRDVDQANNDLKLHTFYKPLIFFNFFLSELAAK